MANASATTGPGGGGLLSQPASYVLVALLVVGLALVVVAVVLLLRRRKSKPQPATSNDEPKPSLATAWEQYLRSLDARLPGARFHPVLVVLGGSKVGKTQLIRRIDWEGQQNQGVPSEPGDPWLPRYCGPGMLVQEVSWDLLRDTGAKARQLEALWSSKGMPTPAVVVVVDVKNLVPEELKSLAGALRGKLEILSRIRGGKVPIRLCLTHMDEIEGYCETVRLLDRRNELVLHLANAPATAGIVDPGAVAACFEPLRRALPRVLVDRDPSELRRAVTFHTREVPDLARRLAPFLGTLLAPAQATHAPELEGIFLSGLDPADHVGDPFVVDPSSANAAVAAVERRSLLHSVGLVGYAAALTTAIFAYDHWLVRRAHDAVGALETEIANARPKDADAADAVEAEEEAASERVRSMQAADGFWLLRGAFARDKAGIVDGFVDILRRHDVLPAVERANDEGRTLYSVALLYAAQDNDIGRNLSNPPTPRWNASEWAKMVGVSELVVKDYAGFSRSAWDQPVQIPKPQGAPDAAEWLSHVTELAAIFATVQPGSIARAPTVADLATYERSNEPFVGELQQSERYGDLVALGNLVRKAAPRDVPEIDALVTRPELPAWVDENRAALLGALGLVDGADLDTPTAAKTLKDLVAQLAAPVPSPAKDATYSITAGSQSFVFATKDWVQVLARARNHALVEAFLAANAPGGRSSAGSGSTYSFFANPGAYPPVGRAAVVGKGARDALPGIYTRNAFNREVAPALDAFAAQIDKVALSDDDRGRLRAGVTAEMDSYSSAYRDALFAYYASFQFMAPSEMVLRATLAELTMPSSWLTEFLRIVSDNASLEIKDGDAYRLMGARLEAFQPIVGVMAEQKGQYPNLEKYASFLAPLVTPAPAAPSDKGPGLADLLSPLGRASLSILREDKDSIALEVESWLTASGIGPNLSEPFLAPIHRTSRLGTAEIEGVAADRWRHDVLRDARGVLKRFPFDPHADDQATAAEIEDQFSPTKGRFWAGFTAFIEPLCIQRNGVWVARSSPRGAPRLPDDTLPTVNDLARMTHALWDADGKAQPILVDVLPQPLPAPDRNDDAATLSTLRIGETAVFGFNQMPTSQRVKIAWWDEGAAAVEVQIGSAESVRKRYLKIEVNDSSWSFYRLLAKSSGPLATWTLTDPPEKDKSVRFELRSDPWVPFRVRVTP